ncbi:hypothetical protein BC829DRAFT_206465, partial [Chytridium lagenaria]
VPPLRPSNPQPNPHTLLHIPHRHHPTNRRRSLPFPQVLQEFEEWLTGFLPPPFDRAIFATDGPWDIRDFVKKQLKISELSKPSYFANGILMCGRSLRKSMVIDVGYRGCWNILGWSLKESSFRVG